MVVGPKRAVEPSNGSSIKGYTLLDDLVLFDFLPSLFQLRPHYSYMGRTSKRLLTD